MPLLLGLAWGLMPCGFLYVAQLKAAETTNLWRGGATMLGLVVAHTLLLGSSYLGSFERSTQHWLGAIVLVSVVLLGLLVRWRGLWSLLSLEKYYAPAKP